MYLHTLKGHAGFDQFYHQDYCILQILKIPLVFLLSTLNGYQLLRIPQLAASVEICIKKNHELNTNPKVILLTLIFI